MPHPNELLPGDLITFRAATVFVSPTAAANEWPSDKALSNEGPTLGVFICNVGLKRHYRAWDEHLANYVYVEARNHLGQTETKNYAMVLSLTGQLLWVRHEIWGSGRGIFKRESSTH